MLSMMLLLGVGVAAMSLLAALPSGYRAKPWQGRAQAIPGKVMAAFYDLGGEGAAYHNQDTKNHGSGELNIGPEEKNNFRKDEGISITYTKAAFDKWLADGSLLPIDQYYVGWTAPGESINYTVDVKAAGTYRINMQASSNNIGAEISLAVGGVDKTGPLVIESTGHWHTWKMYDGLTELTLEQGPQVLTLKFLKEGNMNVMYLEFVPKAK
jgi:hypothetical protein